MRQVFDEAMASHRAEMLKMLNDIKLEIAPQSSLHRAQSGSSQVVFPRGLDSPLDGQSSVVKRHCEGKALFELSAPADPGLRAQCEAGDDEDTFAVVTMPEPEEETVEPLKVDECMDGTASSARAGIGKSNSRRWITKRAIDQAKNKAGKLQRIVSSFWFENSVSALILLNAVVIGVHANHRAQHPWKCETTWSEIFLVFNLVFISELILRIYAHGREFFCGHDFRWNMFDVFIIVAGFLDFVLSHGLRISSSCGVEDSAGRKSLATDNVLSGSISALRILRVLRVLRMIRAFRTMEIFRDLRIMVQSTIVCLMPLVWACTLLWFVIWGFGVYFTNLLADHASDLIAMEGLSALEAESMVNARHFFGSLGASMFTLFLSITGGVNWGEPCSALYDASGDPLSVTLFIVFISLTMFAMLNVITGLFVENAMACAKGDRDLAITSTLREHEEFNQTLVDVFEEADLDQSGKVTIQELHAVYDDPRMLAFFKCLDLDLHCFDATALFRLLDHDRDGFLTPQEFIEGCRHLRGEAKAMDIAEMRADMKAFLDSLPRPSSGNPA